MHNQSMSHSGKMNKHSYLSAEDQEEPHLEHSCSEAVQAVNDICFIFSYAKYLLVPSDGGCLAD